MAPMNIVAVGYPGHRFYVEFNADNVTLSIPGVGKHAMTYRVWRDFVVSMNEVLPTLPLPTSEEDATYEADLFDARRAEAVARRNEAIQAAKEGRVNDWLSRQARDAVKNLPDNED